MKVDAFLFFLYCICFKNKISSLRYSLHSYIVIIYKVGSIKRNGCFAGIIGDHLAIPVNSSTVINKARFSYCITVVRWLIKILILIKSRSNYGLFFLILLIIPDLVAGFYYNHAIATSCSIYGTKIGRASCRE